MSLFRLRKIPIFWGNAPWHTNFTLSCVIPLWYLAKAHSPSSKELNFSSQEDARFSGCCTLACKFHFILCHPSLRLSNSLTFSKEVIPTSLENACFSGLLLHDVLIEFCVGSLLFAIHPYYLPDEYIYAFILSVWKTSTLQRSGAQEFCRISLLRLQLFPA